MNTVKFVTVGLLGRQGNGKDYVLSALKNHLQAQNTATSDTHYIIEEVRFAEPLKKVSASVFSLVMSGYGLENDNGEFERLYKEEAFLFSLEHFRKSLYASVEELVALYGGNHKDIYRIQSECETVFAPYVHISKDMGKIKISPRIFQQLFGTEVFRKNIDFNFWVELAKRRINAIKQSYQHINNNKHNIVLIVCPDVRFENEAEIFESLAYIHRSIRDNLMEKTDFTAIHQSEHLCEKVRDCFMVRNNPDYANEQKIVIGNRIRYVNFIENSKGGNTEREWQDILYRLSNPKIDVT